MRLVEVEESDFPETRCLATTEASRSQFGVPQTFALSILRKFSTASTGCVSEKLFHILWRKMSLDASRKYFKAEFYKIAFCCQYYSFLLSLKFSMAHCRKNVENFIRPWYLSLNTTTTLITSDCSFTESIILAQWL